MTPESVGWVIGFAVLNGTAALLLILGKPRGTPENRSGSPRPAVAEDAPPGEAPSTEPPIFMVDGCPVDPPRGRGEERLIRDLEQWRATLEGGEFLPEPAGNGRPGNRDPLVGSLNDALA